MPFNPSLIKREEFILGNFDNNKSSSGRRVDSTSFTNPFIHPLAEHEALMAYAEGDIGAMCSVQSGSSSTSRTVTRRFLDTLRHIKYRRGVQKQSSRKIFKRPLEISLPINVVGNTPEAQSLLTEGSVLLQQHVGKLMKPPVVFSGASSTGGALDGDLLPGAISSSTYQPVTQLPRPQTSLRSTVSPARLGRPSEALGSHPPYGELRTRTSERKRRGRIFSQSQLTRTLATIDETTAVGEDESTASQKTVNVPEIIITDLDPPLNHGRLKVRHAWDLILRAERSRYDDFVEKNGPAIELSDKLREILSSYIDSHSAETWTDQLETAVRFLDGEQQRRSQAADVVDSLEKFFEPLVQRDQTISWAHQLEALVRSLVHDQKEEAAAVIALNNLWLLLSPDIPHNKDLSWPDALETIVRDLYEDFGRLAATLDHIDEAVRPLVTEDADNDASWFTQLETAVQSLADDRMWVEFELAELRATAERNQRLALLNHQKLQEAKKEIARLKLAIDASMPDVEDDDNNNNMIPEYMPMALSCRRTRPVWPLK